MVRDDQGRILVGTSWGDRFPLLVVPRELPALQPELCAAHGGYTVDEIQGGYNMKSMTTVSSFVIAADGPDTLHAQLRGGKAENTDMWMDYPGLTRSTEDPNKFTVTQTNPCGSMETSLKFAGTGSLSANTKPPTFLVLKQEGGLCGGCCGGPTKYERTDWHAPGGFVLHPDPDWPCAPKGQLMFRDPNCIDPVTQLRRDGRVAVRNNKSYMALGLLW